MSVKERMNKYWENDTIIARRIMRDLGGLKIVFTDPFWESKVMGHRLAGRMKRFAKKYKRLNMRGHLAPIVKRMAEVF